MNGLIRFGFFLFYILSVEMKIIRRERSEYSPVEQVISSTAHDNSFTPDGRATIDQDLKVHILPRIFATLHRMNERASFRPKEVLPNKAYWITDLRNSARFIAEAMIGDRPKCSHPEWEVVAVGSARAVTGKGLPTGTLIESS